MVIEKYYQKHYLIRLNKHLFSFKRLKVINICENLQSFWLKYNPHERNYIKSKTINLSRLETSFLS